MTKPTEHRIFIGMKYEDRVLGRALAGALIKEGHAITSRWLFSTSAYGTHLGSHAERDRDDLDAANVGLIFGQRISKGKDASGGRHFEAGYLTAQGKPVIWCIPPAHPYWTLPEAREVQFPTRPLAAITRIRTNPKRVEYLVPHILRALDDLTPPTGDATLPSTMSPDEKITPPVYPYRGTRGVDAQGMGGFGAPRRRADGSRYAHDGLDILSKPMDAIVAPFPGRVQGHGRAYANDESPGTIHFEGCGAWEGYRAELLYCGPWSEIERGEFVAEGDRIGTAQDVATYHADRGHKGMTNHVHFRLKKDGKVIDPTPLLKV